MLTFISLTLVVILGFMSILILLQNARSRTGLYLAASIALVSIWCMSVVGINTEFATTVEYGRFVFAMGLLSVLSMLRFAHVLLQEEGAHIKSIYLIHATTAYAIFVVLISVSTDLVLQSISDTSSGLLAPVYGQAVVLYSSALVITIGALARTLWVGIRQLKKSAKERTIVVALTLLATVVLSSLTNFVLPAIINDTWTALFTPVPVALFAIGLTYAITKTKLLNIRAAALRSLTYVMLLGTMAAIYFALAYVVSLTLLQGELQIDPRLGLINVALALLLAFLFQPLKRGFDYATREVFFRHEYRSDEFLAKMSSLFANTTHLRKLVDQTVVETSSTLKANYGLLYVVRGESRPIVSVTDARRNFDSEELATLGRLIKQGEFSDIAIVAQDPRVTGKCRQILEKRRADVVIPLMYDGQLLGYMLLGEHRAHGYSSRDINTLRTLTSELVVAVNNALSLHEVRDLNQNLQKRIDAATKELRSSNKKLLKLDEAKDEFISMASHQLRTPLTSIKGYLSMVLDGDVGPVNKQQKQLLTESFASSERMVHLIGDFLNVSRLQTGRFTVETKETDLNRLVREEVESIQRLAESHGMTLAFKPSKKSMVMDVDEGKLRQVIMNFIDNAIYYSREKSVIAVKLYKKHDEMVFEVHDQGIGVPKESQGRLFQKFYRAENARRQRPDGTGVGLFLSKMIVSAHGGELIFESTLGKGSVFGFRLPLEPKK